MNTNLSNIPASNEASNPTQPFHTSADGTLSGGLQVGSYDQSMVGGKNANTDLVSG